MPGMGRAYLLKRLAAGDFQVAALQAFTGEEAALFELPDEDYLEIRQGARRFRVGYSNAPVHDASPPRDEHWAYWWEVDATEPDAPPSRIDGRTGPEASPLAASIAALRAIAALVG